MTQQKHYARVVTIATSDSGGGAGIQADIKTISANGCYAASIIVALTAQNTQKVTAIHATPPDFVTAQMDAVFSDIGADAVKIGMLFSPELIRTVATGLKKYGLKNIVLDPVMVAQSGDKLIKDEAISALKEELIPLVSLLTPNIPEAETLLQRPLKNIADLQQAARDIHHMGCAHVLLKGGHLETEESDDYLFIGAEDRLVALRGGRVKTSNNHGTGCTLSAAIAAFLAHGEDIETAVRHAKEYITGAIRAGADYILGQGHGPVHHFFRFF